jgi:hypothetical protein
MCGEALSKLCVIADGDREVYLHVDVRPAPSTEGRRFRVPRYLLTDADSRAALDVIRTGEAMREEPFVLVLDVLVALSFADEFTARFRLLPGTDPTVVSHRAKAPF